MLKKATFIPLQRVFHHRFANIGLLLFVLAIGGFAVYQSLQKRPSDAAAPARLQPYSLGFAPYAYVPYGDVSVDATYTATGVKQYVLAFINSPGSCTPTWDNDATLGLSSSRSGIIATDINNLRSHGGDVTLSFGGEGGQELANYCTSVATLKAAYLSVINKYNVTRIDFDIEGNNVSNGAAGLRRAQAVASLQQDMPNLKVYVTIAADTSAGLDPASQPVVTDFRDAGVTLAGINLMTMYYGAGTEDGQAAIATAKASFTTLKGMFPSNTDAEIWASIDLTPNIGLTSDKSETFSLADAQNLRNWAGAQKIGMLSMWSAGRDRQCGGSYTLANDTCSGITQTPNQFMGILNMPATILNSVSPSPVPTSATPSPTPSPTAAPLVGDLNNDGHVNVFDLSILLSNWGKTGKNSSDLNGDGIVNIFDLSILLSHWLA